MRATLTGLFILGLASTMALSQEPQKKVVPSATIPFEIADDLSYFESVWGLKKKFFEAELWQPGDRKLVNNRILTAGRLVYVLEFSKDIYNYDLDTLQRFLFLPEGKIRHVFFDAENIAINGMATYGYLIQGEISGVKGDVIRVIVEFGHDLEIMKLDPRGVQQARRLAVRRN